MYNFLYSIYYLRFGHGRFDYVYGKAIIRLMNVLIPIYLKLTFSKTNHRLNNSGEQEKLKYIVSLTTFPARINNVWLTIETIFRQDVKPDAIILWLYKGEFPDKNELPKRLILQEQRGLQIRFCDENLMPHKKYYYAFKSFPHSNIITIDDDFFYPANLLRHLVQCHEKFPHSICCSLTRKIRTENNLLQPYRDWPMMASSDKPSLSLLTMGGWGTLFPVGSFDQHVLDIDAIKRNALFADDLWLKAMSLKMGTKVFSLSKKYPRSFIPIRDKNGYKLMDSNVHGGDNDVIFARLLEICRISTSVFDDE